MRNLLLSDIREAASRILGTCPTDDRVAETLNEAQERLLNRPNNPVGSWCRYRICLTDGCLTLPRQVRTILGAWVCNSPMRFVSEWYESIGWNEGGYGLLSSSDNLSTPTIIDHGTACAFGNVSGATSSSTKKIQAVASNAADNGKKITLRYVDSSGNRKYTSIGGVVQEGEELTLSTSGVLTSSAVANGGLYHVVKAATDYPVRLYSYDVNTAAQSSLIAVYEPSETSPLYRRVLIPGLENMNGCADGDDTDDPKAVTLLVRLQHIPVVVDNDPFVVGNFPALKIMVQAIKMQEADRFAEARGLMADAAAEIDGEISAYLGDAMRISIQVADKDTWGGGAITNAID